MSDGLFSGAAAGGNGNFMQREFFLVLCRVLCYIEKEMDDLL